MASRPEFDDLRVVLVNTRNPLNIGAATRAMSNFGFLHLRVVNPYELAFREARSAVGALPVLAGAEEFRTVAEAVADCTLVVGTTALSRRQAQQPVKRLEEGARLIRKRLAGGRVALLFGSEKRGLSNEDLSHCDWLLHIPTCEAHRSMNLGQAVAVCLYELVRDSKVALQPEKQMAAAGGNLERVTLVLLEALRASGYLKTGATGSRKRPGGGKRTALKATLAEEKIRRFVRRLHLPASDAEVLLGMLRQMLWKLGSGKGS